LLNAKQRMAGADPQRLTRPGRPLH
jgi:hypothetical protein